MGVPYVPIVGLVGSDLMKKRDDVKVVPDPFNPTVRTAVVQALRPQVALLHGLRADRAGNVDMGCWTDDVLLAEASARVIVTVEEIVECVDEDSAQGTFLPSLLVDAVAHAPFGAHPEHFPGRYPDDAAHLQRYVEQARDDAGFAAYLRDTVFDVPDHDAYVQRHVPIAWREDEPRRAAGA